MFQRIGADAYKPGLDTSRRLDDLLGNPHRNYKTIHIAGTNGKGSVAHTLASVLQKSGYKVGLYTSPHLIDFRERIRINGDMIPEANVTNFVDRYLSCHFDGHPSFFELTMMMAFDYFSQEKVDIAVIEVGLGGRLDSTNIITPILSVITNISFDHTQFLGDTLPKIAFEKAGIIKHRIPVVIGEAEGDVRDVFANVAQTNEAPIIFAQDNPQVESFGRLGNYLNLKTKQFGNIEDELTGECQIHNANTILHAISSLKKLGLNITDNAVKEGFHNVCQISGLKGRWMEINDKPRVICDTGHNIGGFTYIVHQLKNENYTNLHIIIGFVNDKDIDHILEILPRNAKYYFTQASIPRALNCDTLSNKASEKGLYGGTFKSVVSAYQDAINKCADTDMVYIGGSTFVVADILSYLNHQG